MKFRLKEKFNAWRNRVMNISCIKIHFYASKYDISMHENDIFMPCMKTIFPCISRLQELKVLSEMALYHTNPML